MTGTPQSLTDEAFLVVTQGRGTPLDGRRTGGAVVETTERDVLARFNFGRAHHRVLHFVNRHPGMKVADLLDVLKITKQSLGRVLKQLVDEGDVVQKEGENDRRQRLLYVTPKGEQLAMKLAGLQTERIARALGEIGPNAHDAARRFLVAMIDADGRDDGQKLIARADRARRTRS